MMIPSIEIIALSRRRFVSELGKGELCLRWPLFRMADLRYWYHEKNC